MPNILDTPRVATLLTRLFAAADASNGLLRARMGELSAEERAARMASLDGYRDFYARARDLYLAISPATGRLLYGLARANNARAVVEYGTSFGISTIHLAAAVRDNGGGVVVGSEFEDGKVDAARANLDEAGFGDLVDVRAGDAVDTLSRDLPPVIDVLLLDGHKALYARILDLVIDRLRPGSIVVADNADACADYVARVRGVGGGFVSVPFGDDVEVSIRT